MIRLHILFSWHIIDRFAEVHIFYQHLYMSKGLSDLCEFLQFVQEKVRPGMNEVLDKPFKPAEMRTTLFQMAPSKAPGVDGFTASFYQRH